MQGNPGASPGFFAFPSIFIQVAPTALRLAVFGSAAACRDAKSDLADKDGVTITTLAGGRHEAQLGRWRASSDVVLSYPGLGPGGRGRRPAGCVCAGDGDVPAERQRPVQFVRTVQPA